MSSFDLIDRLIEFDKCDYHISKKINDIEFLDYLGDVFQSYIDTFNISFAELGNLVAKYNLHQFVYEHFLDYSFYGMPVMVRKLKEYIDEEDKKQGCIKSDSVKKWYIEEKYLMYSHELQLPKIVASIRMKGNGLIRHFCLEKDTEEMGNIIKNLYNSRTFHYLQNKDTGFYIKSQAELDYLLEMEYTEDWVSWEFQAF